MKSVAHIARGAVVLFVAVGLTACASLPNASRPDSREAHSAHEDEHEHDHEHGAAGGRLLVHTLDGTLRVYDAADGDLLAEFTGILPPGSATTRASAGGEFGFVIHAAEWETVVVDSGQVLDSHGNHYDLHLDAPRILGSVRTGARPTHYASAFGRSLVFNDQSGTVALFEEHSLRDTLSFTELRTRVDHGAPILTGEAVVVGYQNAGEIEVFGLDGTLLQRLPGGSRIHGQARIGRFLAFGAREGVVLLTRGGDGTYVSEIVPYPAETPEGGHTGTLVSHVLVPHFVGRIGDALLRVDPVSKGASLHPIPGAFRSFTFDRSGRHLIVLGADGTVYDVDPDTLDVRGSVQAISRSDNPAPVLDAGYGVAWISDPQNSRVVFIDLDHLEVERVIELPSSGSGASVGGIALMLTEGVAH